VEESVDVWAVLPAAAVLAAVHLLAGRMRFLDGVPRSRWLSAAGGVSVAYVFVHLLPELAESQEALAREGGRILTFLEDHAYLVALAGLAVFYGVERASLKSRAERDDEGTGRGAFWLSTASFAVYNAMIGYLLVRGEARSATGVVLFTVALAVHFVINDFGLREHHRDAYEHVARWILAAAIIVGWLAGALTEISEAALALVLAFIAGGIVLNVLKEELPGERRARFLPFVAGSAGYAVLLQAI
jgi:zinc transporter ZupT